MSLTNWLKSLVEKNEDVATRYCEDCKHYFRTKSDYSGELRSPEFAKCASPLGEKPFGYSGLVARTDNKNPESMWFCDTARSSFKKDMCGPRGKFFEAKESS